MGSTLVRRICTNNRNYLLFSRKKKCDKIQHLHQISPKPPHIPVLLNEVIENFNLKEGNTFLDMTFGAGGHSSALIKNIPGLKVIALDRDPLAVEYAYKLQKKYPDQVIPLEGKFSDLPDLLKSIQISQNSIDGVLFDLGCSSMQFDMPERGFSLSANGPLDMRMEGCKSVDNITAADVVAYASEKDLAKIFKTYGQEKKSKQIARALIEARSVFKPLKTTQDLREIIEVICNNQYRVDKLQRKSHISTKVFQALRIFVNNELNELNYGLLLAHKYLKAGSRALAITFHSLEDKIVKRHFANHVRDGMSLKEAIPLSCVTESDFLYDSQGEVCWKNLHKNVITPSDQEVSENPRSRSAKLRVAVKL